MTVFNKLKQFEQQDMREELPDIFVDKYLKYNKIIHELAKIVDDTYMQLRDTDSICKLNLFNTDLLVSVSLESNEYLSSLGFHDLVIRFFSKDLPLDNGLKHSVCLYEEMIGEENVNYKLYTLYSSSSIFDYVPYDFGYMIDCDIIIDKYSVSDKVCLKSENRLSYNLDLSNNIDSIETDFSYFTLEKYHLSNIKYLHLDTRYFTVETFDIVLNKDPEFYNNVFSKIKEYVEDKNNYFSDGAIFEFVVRTKFMHDDNNSCDFYESLKKIIDYIDIKYENSFLIYRGKTEIRKS